MLKGERIKEIRKKRNLTQKQLGELSGIAESTIRSYELGRLNPKYETLEKIAKALKVPVSYLGLEHENKDNEQELDFLFSEVLAILEYDIDLKQKIVDEIRNSDYTESFDIEFYFYHIWYCLSVLNKEGREIAKKYIWDLVREGKYRRETENQLNMDWLDNYE